MLKKWFVCLLAIALALICASCDNPEQTPTSSVTAKGSDSPEAAAKAFLTALYSQQAEDVVSHILPITYDGIVWMAEMSVPNGQASADAILSYFRQDFAANAVTVNELVLETSVLDSPDKEYYLENIHEYYPADQEIVKQTDLARIEDVAFVAFSCEASYSDGTTLSIPMSEGLLPVVKIDGAWYADFMFSVIVPYRVSEMADIAVKQEPPAPQQPN